MGLIVWSLDLQLPVHMQSMPITANAVSSNPAQGDEYSIQYYVIKFVGDLRYVGGCFWVLLWVSFTNKTYIHDITEILLKMALYIITLTLDWLTLQR